MAGTHGARSFGPRTHGALTFGALTLGALTLGALNLGPRIFGPRSFGPAMRGAALGAFACLAASVAAATLAAPPAAAQTTDCRELARRIRDFDKRANSALADRYAAAARRQRDEIDRTIGYGEQSGCWTQGFDQPAPPLCRQLDGRLAKMRANLDDLEARADEASRDWSGGESREQLTYDYDLWCRGDSAEPAPGMRRVPIGPIPPDDAPAAADEDNGYMRVPDVAAPAQDVGDSAICVRTCDGGYFPLTAPVRAGRLDDLQALCTAQCPNVEAKVYTMRKGEDVSKAVGANGDFYAALPNAFRFRKKYDPSCACKPPGKSWGQSLGEAEKLLEEQTGKSDATLSPGEAERLSRPPTLRGGDAETAVGKSRASGKADSRKKTDPAKAEDAAPESPAQAGPVDPKAEYREVIGPDGVKRRIRIVGPKT